MPDRRAKIVEDLGAWGKLLTRIERLDWSERQNLLEEVEKPGVKRMLARLLLHDPSEMVRGAALDVLAEFGTRKDYRCVLAGAADHHWFVRASAYSAAAELRLKGTASLLLKAMADDPEPIARRYAVVAYADLLGQAAIPELLRRLESEKADAARVGIVLALVEFGRTEFLPDLRLFAQHDSPRVSTPATSTLEELGYPATEETDEPGRKGDALRSTRALSDDSSREAEQSKRR